ncbi:MAG: perilipin family protein [Campylobacteraceae bacterium]|nr:perilipin family protein [Campylobacteraceae bacterium]
MEASNAANSDSVIGNAVESVLQVVTNGMQTVQNTVTGTKNTVLSTVNSVMDKTLLTGKVLLPILAVGAIAFAGYHALNIIAKTKRNIKTVKN